MQRTPTDCKVLVLKACVSCRELVNRQLGLKVSMHLGSSVFSCVVPLHVLPTVKVAKAHSLMVSSSSTVLPSESPELKPPAGGLSLGKWLL